MAILAAPRLWCRFCEAAPPEERREAIARALPSFLAVVPLLDDPNLSGPKDEVRRVGVVAAELQRQMVAWNAEGKPARRW